MRFPGKMLVTFGLLAVAGGARADDTVCNGDEGPRSCFVSNGLGHQSCQYIPDSGFFWTNCWADQCGSGFEPQSGSCVPSSATDTTTATATSSRTAAPPPQKDPPGTAAAVNMDTQNGAGQAVEKIAEGASGGQAHSLTDAQNVLALGANYAATIGAIYCAEGANTALTNPSLSGGDFAACRDQFAAAAGMNKAGRKSGYEPDTRVTETEGARGTLKELEKNFGITGDEFLHRMLGSGGSREDLSEMLSSKLGAQKLDQAFAAADAVPPAGEKFAVDLGGGPKPKPASHELRQALRAKLDTTRSPAAAGPTRVSEAKPPEYSHLEAFRTEDLFGAAKRNERELSIFDVVRRKYDELSRRYSLVPGRWPTRK